MSVPKTNYTAVKIIKLVTCVIQILIHPVKNKRNIGLKKLLGFFCSSVYNNKRYLEITPPFQILVCVMRRKKHLDNNPVRLLKILKM